MFSLMKSLLLIVYFYRSIAAACWLVNLLTAFAIYLYGAAAVMALLWFKILSLLVTWILVNNYRPNAFYFYKNLGFGKGKMWLYSLLMDCTFFVLLLFLALYLR